MFFLKVEEQLHHFLLWKKIIYLNSFFNFIFYKFFDFHLDAFLFFVSPFAGFRSFLVWNFEFNSFLKKSEIVLKYFFSKMFFTKAF